MPKDIKTKDAESASRHRTSAAVRAESDSPGRVRTPRRLMASTGATELVPPNSDSFVDEAKTLHDEIHNLTNAQNLLRVQVHEAARQHAESVAQDHAQRIQQLVREQHAHHQQLAQEQQAHQVTRERVTEMTETGAKLVDGLTRRYEQLLDGAVKSTQDAIQKYNKGKLAEFTRLAAAKRAEIRKDLDDKVEPLNDMLKSSDNMSADDLQRIVNTKRQHIEEAVSKLRELQEEQLKRAHDLHNTHRLGLKLSTKQAQNPSGSGGGHDPAGLTFTLNATSPNAYRYTHGYGDMEQD